MREVVVDDEAQTRMEQVLIESAYELNIKGDPRPLQALHMHLRHVTTTVVEREDARAALADQLEQAAQQAEAAQEALSPNPTSLREQARSSTSTDLVAPAAPALASAPELHLSLPPAAPDERAELGKLPARFLRSSLKPAI